VWSGDVITPELRKSPSISFRRWKSRVSFTTSAGVNNARRTSLVRRFTQYRQS
jgi:hypothetical protein